MKFVATLPMYDIPEAREHTDALWRYLAQAMRDVGIDGVPDRLLHDLPLAEGWRRDNLLFSQTCGYPLMHEFRDLLQPVATPRYRAPGCRGAEYSSAVLVRAGDDYADVTDLRGAVCAVNSPVSQSGYSALRALVAPLAKDGRFFSQARESGSHAASMEAVARGEADVCAVDCVTHALLDRYRPAATSGLRVLTYTDFCPGLPYVTVAGAGPDRVRRLRAALEAVFGDPAAAEAREALLIDGFEALGFGDYQPVLDMQSRAAAAGYAEIR